VVLVRACESNYPTDLFEAEGIKVYDLCFQDGGVPSRVCTQVCVRVPLYDTDLSLKNSFRN
jgi:hypothetical protein